MRIETTTNIENLFFLPLFYEPEAVKEIFFKGFFFSTYLISYMAVSLQINIL